IDAFMEAMNFYSLKSSMEIAKERKETFYRYEDSEYSNGNYFKDYVTKEDSKLHPDAIRALGNIPLITKEMWAELAKDVQKYGIFHSYRLATAPTGSISYIRSCSASIAPITERV